MRPFYIEADIEGRKTPLHGGPARRDGSIDMTITQRSEGQITTAFRVRCYHDTYTDELVTVVTDKAGNRVAENRTRY